MTEEEFKARRAKRREILFHVNIITGNLRWLKRELTLKAETPEDAIAKSLSEADTALMGAVDELDVVESQVADLVLEEQPVADGVTADPAAVKRQREIIGLTQSARARLVGMQWRISADKDPGWRDVLEDLTQAFHLAKGALELYQAKAKADWGEERYQAEMKRREAEADGREFDSFNEDGEDD